MRGFLHLIQLGLHISILAVLQQEFLDLLQAARCAVPLQVEHGDDANGVICL